MTETLAALFVFFSIGVFLAHAFDAYRTGYFQIDWSDERATPIAPG
jgi:hypothetical protein